MGDRSRQLPRMPLHDFVIALTFVLSIKFGSSARTFYEIHMLRLERMKWMRCHQSGRNIAMYTHHGEVKEEQAKVLPIVDNANVSSRYGRK